MSRSNDEPRMRDRDVVAEGVLRGDRALLNTQSQNGCQSK